jgi:molybdopterin molybdotransferase
VKSVDEHLAQCLAAVGVLSPSPTPLLAALDCLLAEDVVSPVHLPAFDNSAMDGYAVHVQDVARATPEHPSVLDVVGDVPAGAVQPPALDPGVAVRIMTGAPLPPGAEAVVPVEWTDRGIHEGTERVAVQQAPRPGQYVRRVGEDVTAGDVVLFAGTRLSPRHLALLAAVGRAEVLVRRRPRVAVLSTGSELVPPGEPLAFGQIHDSNGYGLAAAVEELGATAQHLGIVPDDPKALLATLEERLDGVDLVLTSGGVSAGAYDTVKEVLSSLGTVRFDRVAMQPGMPQGFGTIGPRRTPIFTLPGNPVSAMVSFEVFVRPVIRRMWGEPVLHRHTVLAAAAAAWTSPAGKRQFARAALERGRDGAGVVVPVGGQGSHLVADLAGATCLAVVPEDVTHVKVGDTLRCMLLDRSRR